MSIQSELERIARGKAEIKEAIEGKGVTVGSEKLDDYDDLVAKIAKPNMDTVPARFSHLRNVRPGDVVAKSYEVDKIAEILVNTDHVVASCGIGRKRIVLAQMNGSDLYVKCVGQDQGTNDMVLGNSVAIAQGIDLHEAEIIGFLDAVAVLYSEATMLCLAYVTFEGMTGTLAYTDVISEGHPTCMTACRQRVNDNKVTSFFFGDYTYHYKMAELAQEYQDYLIWHSTFSETMKAIVEAMPNIDGDDDRRPDWSTLAEEDRATLTSLLSQRETLYAALPAEVKDYPKVIEAEAEYAGFDMDTGIFLSYDMIYQWIHGTSENARTSYWHCFDTARWSTGQNMDRVKKDITDEGELAAIDAYKTWLVTMGQKMKTVVNAMDDVSEDDHRPDWSTLSSEDEADLTAHLAAYTALYEAMPEAARNHANVVRFHGMYTSFDMTTGLTNCNPEYYFKHSDTSRQRWWEAHSNWRVNLEHEANDLQTEVRRHLYSAHIVLGDSAATTTTVEHTGADIEEEYAKGMGVTSMDGDRDILGWYDSEDHPIRYRVFSRRHFTVSQGGFGLSNTNKIEKGKYREHAGGGKSIFPTALPVVSTSSPNGERIVAMTSVLDGENGALALEAFNAIYDDLQTEYSTMLATGRNVACVHVECIDTMKAVCSFICDGREHLGVFYTHPREISPFDMEDVSAATLYAKAHPSTRDYILNVAERPGGVYVTLYKAVQVYIRSDLNGCAIAADVYSNGMSGEVYEM